MAEEPRIVFMGTSPFAAIILAVLHKSGLVPKAVYTRPDSPAGRGMALRESAVKTLAEELGLPFSQPVNFREQAARAELADLAPDFLIVAAYGLILPQAVLDIPAIAPINVHGSLLPKYRGAAPIQRAIMENWQPDAKTGVAIMRMEAGMDTGPVYASAETGLAGKTTAMLTEELAALGGGLLTRILPRIASGALQPIPQDESAASYAAKLTKADGLIDWQGPAAKADALIRAVTPWPGAQALLRLAERELPVTILEASPGSPVDAPAGAIRLHRDGLAIACQDNWLEILWLQPKGRKKMTAKAFANGLRLAPGIIGRA